jgi:hypothetical protein
MVRKEERELFAELDELGFVWEMAKRSRHIKAVAPDGQTFTFSTGGSYRSILNQRSLLKRWRRENRPPEVPSEEPEPEVDDNDKWGMTILEKMTMGQPFTALDVTRQTNLTRDQAISAIEYLIDADMLVESDGAFVIPVEEVPMALPLSPLAIAGIEAMVDAIRAELQGDDNETYKVANEALQSEVIRLRAEDVKLRFEITTATDQVQILQRQISNLTTNLKQSQVQLENRKERVKELEEENSKLQVVVQKYNEFKKLFT